MTNKEAESRIKKAVESCTPDVLDRVRSQCTDKKGEVITMTKKNNNNFVRKFGIFRETCPFFLGQESIFQLLHIVIRCPIVTEHFLVKEQEYLIQLVRG